MARQGVNTFRTQVLRGAAKEGPDFGAFIGRGRNVRLFLNEAKDWASPVRAHNFTAFGLGKRGASQWFKNRARVLQSINRLNIDDVTKAELRRQLRNNDFGVMMFGNAAKGNPFSLATRAQFRAGTGVRHTQVRLVDVP